MKKIEYIGILLLFALSLIYLNKTTNILKDKDPIMQNIVHNANNYKIESVNAKINEDTIIPGTNGCVIDINKSYEKMKKINEYTDKMLKYKDLIPEITINNIYNKYIISGNETKRNVSIIININEEVEKLNTLVSTNKIKLNVFLDSEILKNDVISINKEYVKIYNGGLNNNYDDITIEWMNDVIMENYNQSKYCINRNKNDDNLLVCARNKMHTITPTINVTKSNMHTAKKQINNGSIIYFDEKNIDNIITISDYIKSKGFKIVFLEELLSEKTCK